MTYRALRSSPLTRKTDEQVPGAEPGVRYHEVTRWPVLGIVESYQEARERFGGRPVLEWIGEPQIIDGD